MSGLVKKPRVRWDNFAMQWAMNLPSGWCLWDNTISGVCKQWFDCNYGKGNHGYR